MRPIIVTALVLALVAACGDMEVSEQTDTPDGPRTVVPEAGEGYTLAGAEDIDRERVSDDQEEDSLQIPLESGELLVEFLDTNLTGNEFEEQVVAFKRSDDSEDRVHLRVIEANINEGGHSIRWEGTTSATGVRSLNITAEDVFGDGEPEIVVIGENSDGEQTIDIFRRTSGAALSYTQVASVASEGSVELVRHERLSEQERNEDTIDPYEILARSEEEDRENVLDVVETRYEWSEESEEYVETSREEIAGGDIAEERLEELYDGGSAEFEDFLSGIWYREDSDGLQLVTFSPRSEQVVFNGGDMQESFDWEVSRKTVSSGIQISMRNRNVRSLNTFVRVQVPELDRVEVTVNDSDRWDGTYRRVNDSLRQTLTGSSGGHVSLSDTSLDGTYEDDAGTRIDFSGSRFEMRNDGEVYSGGFALYEAGEPVMEMVMVDDRGRKVDRRTYTIELEEEEMSDRIVRSLALNPAKLTVSGAESTAGESLRLEQVELLDEDDEIASEE
ncbi:MAG: pallilysin-related adhesin [Spirochaetales bacterium]